MAVCSLSLTGSQYTQTGNIEEEMWIKLAQNTTKQGSDTEASQVGA